MAERDFQAFIARLCVDAAARDRFLSKGAIDAGPELTSVERARLRILQQSGGGGLQLLAGILSGKRQSRVRSLLPRVAAHVAKSDWHVMWEQYVRLASPVPPSDPRQDAAAFAHFAAPTLQGDRVAAALLEYDAAYNESAADSGDPLPPQPPTLDDAYDLVAVAARPRVVRSFDLDVLMLIRQPRQAASVSPADSTLLFFRPFGVQMVRVSRIGEMAALLLDRADGTRTLNAVLSDARFPRPRPDDRWDARIRGLVQRLWTAGALGFVEPPARRAERR
jgi:hypothetical protein